LQLRLSLALARQRDECLSLADELSRRLFY
jgi:hypothetical protein